ncbi:MAG: radical SAM protein, partial [Verrucomicrobia bacterium]|nr:radical SAM protein [Verrucomicrobiota bacterium]
MSGLINLAKKQYVNYRYFKAYTIPQFLREVILLPWDMRRDDGRSSRVLNLALFVTLRCNAQCAMCNLSELLNRQGDADMPLDRMERLLDEVAPHRPGIILFGGEPFVRKDIVELVQAVKKRKLPVGLFTNGLLLNEDLAQRLITEGLDYIAFSLQGTREVHDRILAAPRAYDKMVANIERFVRTRPRRTKVITHTTICDHNLDDLESLAETALGLGVDLVRFGHPTFYSPEEGAVSTQALKKAFPDDPRIHATSWIYDVKEKADHYIE